MDENIGLDEVVNPSVRIVGWMYEDDLPDGYPYEEMYKYSKVDFVRMFPVFAPCVDERNA